MIKVRVKGRPNEVVTYSSERDILDLKRWGLILEVVHNDADTVEEAEDEVLPESDLSVNDTGEDVTVKTLEQLNEEAAPEVEKPKRRSRRKSSSDSSEDEQE